MSPRSDVDPTKPVGRSDIESKLREIRGEVDSTATAAKPAAMAVAGAAVVLLLAGACSAAAAAS